METPISHRQASGRVGVAPEQSPHAVAGPPEERRAARGTLRAALATVVAASAVPYGYTLAIWGSGAVLLRSLGAPTAAEVFIFAAGASAGFYLVGRLLGLLASATPGSANPTNRYEDRVLAGAFDWIAVGPPSVPCPCSMAFTAGFPGWSGPSPRPSSTCSSRALSWLLSSSARGEFHGHPQRCLTAGMTKLDGPRVDCQPINPYLLTDRWHGLSRSRCSANVRSRKQEVT